MRRGKAHRPHLRPEPLVLAQVDEDPTTKGGLRVLVAIEHPPAELKAGRVDFFLRLELRTEQVDQRLII
jgi:hypothetical protein